MVPHAASFVDENTIEDLDDRPDADDETGLFDGLAGGAGFECLAQFQRASGQAPLPRQGLVPALHEDDAVVTPQLSDAPVTNGVPRLDDGHGDHSRIAAMSAHGFFIPPHHDNEPILSYAPGTPERAELQEKLDHAEEVRAAAEEAAKRTLLRVRAHALIATATGSLADYRATRPKVERKIGHLMRRRHGGRRARVRGTTKIGADFALLAAAVNLARLAVLGVVSTGAGWVAAA